MLDLFHHGVLSKFKMDNNVGICMHVLSAVLLV